MKKLLNEKDILYYIKKYDNFICIYKKYTSNLNKIKSFLNDILIVNINVYKRYKYLKDNYNNFSKIITHNFRNLKKKIINYDFTKYKYIFINDNYMTTNSPEIKYIINNNFKKVNLKTSFTISDNYLFVKNNINAKSHILDYNKSYFLPILLII